MIVAKHRDDGRDVPLGNGQHCVPGARISGLVHLQPGRIREPLGHQTCLALIDLAVIGREFGLCRQAVQLGKQIDGAGVKRRFVLWRRIKMFAQTRVAEILEQQQALVEIARQDRRCGEAMTA